MNDHTHPASDPWSEELPPARDPAFVLGVLREAERRRFRARVIDLIVLCSIVMLACALLAPALAVFAGSLYANASLAVTMLTIVAAMMIAVDPPRLAR